MERRSCWCPSVLFVFNSLASSQDSHDRGACFCEIVPQILKDLLFWLSVKLEKIHIRGVEPRRTRQAASQWSKFISLVLLFLHHVFTVAKSDKGSCTQCKRTWRRKHYELYFSVMTGNVTRLRIVFRLCTLNSLWKSLVEWCGKVFCCVFIHLHTRRCGYLAPKNY